MTETPEQKARREIDAKLIASGWLVQDRDDLDLTAGRGVAVREFPMKPGFGFADYLLYLDRKAVGAVEAKAAGTLTGVEHSPPSTQLVYLTICRRIVAHSRTCSNPTVR